MTACSNRNETSREKNSAEQTENEAQSSKPLNASTAEHILTKLDDLNDDSINLEAASAQTGHETEIHEDTNLNKM